uniref:Uncharacterized protein n=1 Tax=Rhizophora mucronata TaxID=61149 RepID=A0A2P2R2J1_RHIMU
MFNQRHFWLGFCLHNWMLGGG